MEYSKLLRELPSSPIRNMMVRAATLKDVISFSVGEPDFLPQESVLEAARAALKISTKYAPGAGLDILRDTYVEYLNGTLGVDYTRENVVVTTGGMSALFLSFACILNPGDEVLVSSPYFTNYSSEILMNNGVPVMVEVYEKDNFVVTLEAIREAITPKTKVILLNSPCNPTGGIIDKDTLKQIADIAKEKDLFVISDEVYRHILFDGEEYCSIAAIDGMKERTLIIDSCSKSSAMTGFRVGFAAGPKELIALFIRATENVYSSVTTVAQYAAVEALKNGGEYRNYMCLKYEERRDYIYDRINKMNKLSCIKPKGAFYAFVNVKNTGMDGNEFANRLLEEKRVAVVPGIAFGENGRYYVRMAYGTSMENLEKGLDRIEEFLNDL
ncbi:pyridoxal phosphate-dependent aminotransferase [Clostridium sp. 19966]|uniref:pyridoxal phosphate-dependent aminotransferase n=1 Tax=Clostridium sp. 19966 TaxID=2768166 RepID=UPI0028DDD6CC|nr:pyridoxal phosphate-dependent aminotransferase [Clostridium sp. 19966]MDT8717523.1 pyridoxal phosphate-dependent aminotransferase [Clostridium sp. 19966]